MKRIIIITIICGLTNWAFSQNFGINIADPGATLTVKSSATDPGIYDNGKSLFVSGSYGSGQASDGGIEFRHDNLTQGIGFGYNTIYQAGTNANQDLNLMSKGTSPLTLNAYGGGNVGIGTSAPGAKLHVEGQIKITGGAPGAGKVLTSDATGLATWATSAALDYGNSSTGGPRPVGNFGQFQAHGTTTDFNTVPGYWGWNYVQGTGNAPNATSTQWYRGVFSLGDAYPARGAGGYSLELAFPRYNHADAGAWMRTVENGSIGGWTPIGSASTNVTSLLNDFSGFPSGSYGFTTSGGSIMISVSGSGYASTAKQIGVDVYVDGVFRGRARGFTNESSSHKAFTSGFIVVNGLAAGSHTVTFGNFNGTIYDFNDPFNASVIEVF